MQEFYQAFLLTGKIKSRTELCVLYAIGKVLKAGNQFKMLETRFSGVGWENCEVVTLAGNT